MDTTPNLPDNVQLNVKPEVALAFGIGTALGSIGMSLVARHHMKKLVQLTDKQAARHQATQRYLMDKLGPYAPKEELADIVDYMQTNYMETVEEGIELGVPSADENETN